MIQESLKQSEFQKPTRPVEIVGMGMLTPVGADADMSAASVRAGVSAFQVSPFHTNRFKPMTLALVPDDALPALQVELAKQGLTARQQRMLCLAAPALQQAMEEIDQPLPLMLCGPEKMPGRRSVVSDKFLRQLQIQSECTIDLENSYVFPDGRAGGLLALEVAMQLLEQGGHRQVVIGGVDTWLDPQLLGFLDNEARVLAEGVMDGFVPGEGAAFLVLRLASEKAKIRIHPPGIGEEPGHRYSQQPYRGDGLAQALDEAFGCIDVGPVVSVFSSFNGENFSAREWGVAAIRNQQRLDAEFSIEHPADCYGDLGAATAPVLLVLAAIGMQKGYYKGPSLVWASSEFQQRAAVVMT